MKRTWRAVLGAVAVCPACHAFAVAIGSRGGVIRTGGKGCGMPVLRREHLAPIYMSKAENTEGSKGVTVTLAPYKDKALQVRVPRIAVSDAQLAAALASHRKPYRLTPVRFVEEGGTKMGHTVIINWQSGRVKRELFELELTLDQPEPFRTFAAKIAVGMGQMETKVFPVAFPADFPEATLAGQTAQVTAVVRQITRKEAKEPDPRPDAAVLTELRERAAGQGQARMDQLADEEIRKAMLDKCHVDAEKVFSSVSWAKFGEKSALDFKWNCIKERVAAVEGIEARDVATFLRGHADIVYVAAGGAKAR